MEVPLLSYACYLLIGIPIIYIVLKGLTHWVFKTEKKVNIRKRHGF